MAVREMTLSSDSPEGLRMITRKTWFKEKIMLGQYGGVSKIPKSYFDHPGLDLATLPPMKAKIHHLVPVNKDEIWKAKDKIRFVDEDGNKFCKDVAVKSVRDVVISWRTGDRPAMHIMEVYVDEEKIGELRLYAGVLVHVDAPLKIFAANEGFSEMILFARMYNYREKPYRLQLLTLV